MRSCRPWVDAELHALRPQAVVCLGATVAKALLGRGFRLTHDHGRLIESDLARIVTASFHPAAILRAPDGDSRRERFEQLVGDLALVREACTPPPPCVADGARYRRGRVVAAEA